MQWVIRFNLAFIEESVKVIKSIYTVVPFISCHSQNNSCLYVKGMIENVFPIKHLTKVSAFFFLITIFFLKSYMWRFIVFTHSCQYLSTHNEIQLKRLWIIHWPQTEFFWMSFWVLYKSPVILCHKKNLIPILLLPEESNSLTILDS